MLFGTTWTLKKRANSWHLEEVVRDRRRNNKLPMEAFWTTGFFDVVQGEMLPLQRLDEEQN